jgi:phosphatidate cytidylyltransferase
MTAGVLIPLVVGAVHVGGMAYVGTIALVVLAAAFEWGRMTGNPHRWSETVVIGGTLAVLLVLASLGMYWAASLVLVAGLLSTAILGWTSDRMPWWPLGGLVVLALTAISLVWLRQGETGRLAIYFLLAAIWATDTGAYFAGRAIGGARLAPRISPKKTWSGAIGGAVSAVAVALAISLIVGERPNASRFAVLAVGVSVAGQLGDLLESAVKRRFDVKDSGKLFPGHGGVLDRIDSLLVAAPFTAAVAWLAGGNLPLWR